MSSQEILDEFARFKYVVENIKDVIWEANPNIVFTYISPTVKDLVGYTAKQVLGHNILEFLTEDSKKFVIQQLSQTSSLSKDRTSLYDVEFVCQDGHTIWCEVSVKPVFKDDSLICFIGISRDISEKKMYEKRLQEMLENEKRANEQLEDMLTYDMLTGAYNRRNFEHFIGTEIDKAEKYGSPFSISIFDIDNFKHINDIYGHNTGDRVLQDITALIKCTLRTTDKLFRWGGDEFIVLLPDSSLKNAMKVAHKIKETIQVYEFGLEDRFITVSLGVGAYEKGETPEQFVARIDKALLRAKNNGKNLVEQG